MLTETAVHVRPRQSCRKAEACFPTATCPVLRLKAKAILLRLGMTDAIESITKKELGSWADDLRLTNGTLNETARNCSLTSLPATRC